MCNAYQYPTVFVKEIKQTLLKFVWTHKDNEYLKQYFNFVFNLVGSERNNAKQRKSE